MFHEMLSEQPPFVIPVNTQGVCNVNVEEYEQLGDAYTTMLNTLPESFRPVARMRYLAHKEAITKAHKKLDKEVESYAESYASVYKSTYNGIMFEISRSFSSSEDLSMILCQGFGMKNLNGFEPHIRRANFDGRSDAVALIKHELISKGWSPVSTEEYNVSENKACTQTIELRCSFVVTQ